MPHTTYPPRREGGFGPLAWPFHAGPDAHPVSFGRHPFQLRARRPDPKVMLTQRALAALYVWGRGVAVEKRLDQVRVGRLTIQVDTGLIQAGGETVIPVAAIDPQDWRVLQALLRENGRFVADAVLLKAMALPSAGRLAHPKVLLRQAIGRLRKMLRQFEVEICRGGDGYSVMDA